MGTTSLDSFRSFWTVLMGVLKCISIKDNCFCISTGPPAPSSVNVSMAMTSGGAGLSVSWELGQVVHGSIFYHVMSDQGLTCNSSSSSCVLSVVGCGELHTIQVIASNEAGPSYPSSPVPFITCKNKGPN